MYNQIYTKSYLILVISTLLVSICGHTNAANDPPLRPWIRPSQRGLSSRTQPQQQQQQQPQSQLQLQPQNVTTGTAVEVAPPVNAPPIGNRTTRTADVFKDGDGYNIFVTNTCERESMKVNIRTSRPFYGVIHTKDQRKKQICSIEATGDIEYNLDISHVLNTQDPAYCGVIRARKDSPEDKDILSVVVAVRFHRNIELSDDKFFLLNCTNRCRRADCSNPNAKLFDPDDSVSRVTPTNTNNRPLDEDTPSAGEREGGPANGGGNTTSNADECTVWKFPWLITLLWCLGILLLAMIISHCIMCSSMVCRCVKTEVEETEPSVYEGATDYEDDQYNKRHPYRIDYDNKDIYKTSNNYAPYCLEEAQTKSRRKQKQGMQTNGVRC